MHRGAQGDRHCAKIKEQTASLTALAHDLEASGAIDTYVRDEILVLVDRAQLSDWRPLVYVFPWPASVDRVFEVPASQRASVEMEYIVKDLTSPEFESVELI